VLQVGVTSSGSCPVATFGVCDAAHSISVNINGIRFTGYMVISDKNSVLRQTLPSKLRDARYPEELGSVVTDPIFHDQLTSPNRILLEG
jgi:hypothetical protein